jgi:hypothetical protein
VDIARRHLRDPARNHRPRARSAVRLGGDVRHDPLRQRNTALRRSRHCRR